MRLCSPHCGISPESGSGGEVYERELLRGLASLGVANHILLARGKPYPRDVPRWTIHPVWPPKGLRWPITPLVFPRYIKRVWDRDGFDLLRAHSVRYVGPAAFLARRRYRLPVPIVVHHHHLDPSPLNPYLDKRVLAAADCVVTDSDFARRQLADELGLETGHVRVVHCGVGSEFRPAPRDGALARRLGLDGKRVLLSVGPLIERKNPFFALEVLREVRGAVGPDVVLVWVGTGPLRQRLDARVHALGLDGAVVFTGYLPEADKLGVLNLADVFVFPSLLEGFPLAPLEAMSCARPVVAFSVASLPEMIENGASGFLTAPNDLGAFAAAVARLLTDDRLRARVGTSAADRVDKLFRWDLMVRNVLRVYEEVVRAFGGLR